MASAPDLRLPVAAQGRLRLDAPSGRRLDLEANGNALTLEVPTWTELRLLSPAGWAARSSALRKLAAVLEVSALTLTLASHGKPFLELGAGVRPNLLTRLARLGPARLSASVVRFYFRR